MTLSDARPDRRLTRRWGRDPRPQRASHGGDPVNL